MVLLNRSCWRNGEGSVCQCFKWFVPWFFSFFSPPNDTDSCHDLLLLWKSQISCLVDLILPVAQCGCRRDEKKVPLEYWCVLCSLSGFSSRLLFFIFCSPLRAQCVVKLAWARDQPGCDWLTLLWASVTELKWFLFVCVCVSLGAQRYQSRRMQSYRFLVFSH